MKNSIMLLIKKLKVLNVLVSIMILFSINQVKAHTFQLAIDSTQFNYPVNSAVVFSNCYDFVITMTVDNNGISSNGGVINIQFPPNWGFPQDTAPNGVNYFSIICSNSTVTFSKAFNYLNPIKGIMTNVQRIGTFTVTSGNLVAGDIVEFKYGNLDGGDQFGFMPGRHAGWWPIYYNTKNDNSSAYSSVDSLLILLTPQPLYRYTAVARSNPKLNIPFELKVVAFDAHNNPIVHLNHTIYFSNVDGQMLLPASYTFNPALDSGVKSFFLTITDYNVHRIQIIDSMSGFTALSNPLIVDTNTLQNWWGDLHTHSIYSNHGMNLPIDAFNYGKKISFLDFLAYTEHSYIVDSLYRAGIAVSNSFNSDNNFVTLNGYEWSSINYGHKCVYFNSDNPPGITTAINTPNVLLSTVKQQGGLVQCSHSTGLWGSPRAYYTDWDYFDPTVQTNAEITGNSGLCFEMISADSANFGDNTYILGTSVQDGLARHYIFGFLGTSDNHEGRPGKNVNGEYNYYYTNQYYPALTSKDVGITCILAQTLTRNDIFNAMSIRHNYATTGERILLDFRIDNHIMGDAYQWDTTHFPTITGIIHGTDSLLRVEIIKNNVTLKSFNLPPNTWDYSFSLIDSAATINSFYYLRVSQYNIEMAWSSPIWLLSSGTGMDNPSFINNQFDVNVFPNPNSGSFTVKFFNNFSSSCIVKLTDVTGKVVYSKELSIRQYSNVNYDINVPGLANGIYTLSVDADNYTATKKINIQK